MFRCPDRRRTRIWTGTLAMMLFMACDLHEGSSECVPRTCAEQNHACGDVTDGCGEMLACGQCESTHSCEQSSSGNICVCEPKTCTEVLANCGEIEDGCGGTVECGECGELATCGLGDHANVCAPKRDTAICERGFCWENPLPLAIRPRALAAASDNEVWVVADRGRIMRFDGSTWQLVEGGTTANLTDVWAPSPGRAFAVGAEGTVLSWDGAAWSHEDLGVESEHYYVVSGSSAEDVWLIGRDQAFRLVDGEWTTLIGNPPRMYDLFVGSGAWGLGSDGTIFEYRAGGFEAVFSDDDYSFANIAGIGGDVYVGGWRDIGEVSIDPNDPVFNPFDYQGVVLRGPNSWQTVVEENETNYSALWANNEQVLVCDRYGDNVRAIVGAHELPGLGGEQAVIDVASASRQKHFLLREDGNVFVASDGDDRWIAQQYGFRNDLVATAEAGETLFVLGRDGSIHRHDGGGFVSVRAPQGEFLDLAALSTEEVWAVGNESQIVKGRGARFERVEAPPQNYVFTSVVAHEGAIWIAGLQGIYQHVDDAWVLRHTPPAEALVQRMVSDGETLYALAARTVNSREAEYQSFLLSYDGQAWTETTLVGLEYAFSLWVGSPTDIWIGGSQVEKGTSNDRHLGALAHFDGSDLTVYERGELGQVTALVPWQSGWLAVTPDQALLAKIEGAAMSWSEFNVGVSIANVGRWQDRVVLVGESGAVLISEDLR